MNELNESNESKQIKGKEYKSMFELT